MTYPCQWGVTQTPEGGNSDTYCNTDVPKPSLSEVSQTGRTSSVSLHFQRQPRGLQVRDKKQSSDLRGCRGGNKKLRLGRDLATQEAKSPRAVISIVHTVNLITTELKNGEV